MFIDLLQIKNLICGFINKTVSFLIACSRFLVYAAENMKFKKKWWYSNWQCSQYLDLNPTCALVSAKEIISNAKLWQSEGNVVKNHQITPHAHKMSKWSPPSLYLYCSYAPPNLEIYCGLQTCLPQITPLPQELDFPMMNFAETLDVHQKATVSLTVVKVKDFYVTARSN